VLKKKKHGDDNRMRAMLRPPTNLWEGRVRGLQEMWEIERDEKE